MEFSNEDKEIGRKLFLGDCQFIKSCVSLDTLPLQNNSEVAFFGRSNVGKSSLINSLTNKKKLAKFSKTPGRTRQLNFFKIENKLHSLNFVDLPGYGFAKVSKTEQREWRNLIFNYIKFFSKQKFVHIRISSFKITVQTAYNQIAGVMTHIIINSIQCPLFFVFYFFK